MIKVSELTGAALDWAVAKCVGHLDARRVVVDLVYMSGHDPVRWEPRLDVYYSSAYSPSTDWAQGGPIIEHEGIDLWCGVPDSVAEKNAGWLTAWRACYHRCGVGTEPIFGPTPLIAAMRCYVASKLGDEVDIPMLAVPA
jgi:hypothetical protein